MLKNLVVSANRAPASFPLSANKIRLPAYARQGVPPGVILHRYVMSSSRSKLNRAGEVGSPCFSPRCISISVTGDPRTQIIVLAVITLDISNCLDLLSIPTRSMARETTACGTMSKAFLRLMETTAYGLPFLVGPHKFPQTQDVDPTIIDVGEPRLQFVDVNLSQSHRLDSVE